MDSKSNDFSAYYNPFSNDFKSISKVITYNINYRFKLKKKY